MMKEMINGGNPNGVVFEYKCRRCREIIPVTYSRIPDDIETTTIRHRCHEGFETTCYGVADLVGWKVEHK